MTLMRDLARFNVSNCNVVTNNRVYLLSYNVGLFVVLQQHRLRVQSNAGDQRVLPRGGGGVGMVGDEQGLEGDVPARTRICPFLRLPHTRPCSSHIALSIHLIGGDNVAITLAGSRR